MGRVRTEHRCVSRCLGVDLGFASRSSGEKTVEGGLDAAKVLLIYFIRFHSTTAGEEIFSTHSLSLGERASSAPASHSEFQKISLVGFS